MERWVDIPLGTRTYQPRSGTQSVARLVNLYAEPSEEGGKTPATLYGDPGLVSFATVGTGPIRGLWRAFGYIWVVSGQELYAVSESSSASSLIGDIAGLQPVRMTNNLTHIGIATDTYFYAANASGITTVTGISGLIGLCFQDGYGIAVERLTQKLWITGLDDMTTINGLDFTTVDRKTDSVITCVSDQGEVWVGKQDTIEVFANSGQAAFPFTRVGMLEYGVVSPGSMVGAGGSVLWLGNDADGATQVYRSSGYQATSISTPAIERLIEAQVSPNTAEAFVYSQGGHTHYVLSFSEMTLVYNMTTGSWRERSSFGELRWRGQCHMSSGTTHYVGDFETGDVYTLSLDTYDDNGDPIQRTMISPPLSDEPNEIIVHELFVDMEAGVGLTSGDGSDPTLLMSWSDDDGRTYSNEREMKMGALGKYRHRAKATRLGKCLNRSFRFRTSDPVKIAILRARARIEVIGQ
jgi:hypothetical protein